MRFISGLLILLFLLTDTACPSTSLLDRNIEQSVHAATIHTGQRTLSDSTACSATAIGPHAILTATHCELPSDDLYATGRKSMKIVGRVRDGNDHTIYFITGETFTTYATVDQAGLSQGTDVFFFGNPETWDDILRRGYVTGVQRILGFPEQYLFSFEADHGDSGAAVFDYSGRVVSVISRRANDRDDGTQGIIEAAGFPLAFSADDLKKAALY